MNDESKPKQRYRVSEGFRFIGSFLAEASAFVVAFIGLAFMVIIATAIVIRFAEAVWRISGLYGE